MKHIPVNFKIPKHYSKVYEIHIEGEGFMKITISKMDGLRMGEMGNISPKNTSLVLDWVQETMERIESECDDSY